MTYADTQIELGFWKPSKKKFDAKYGRKVNFCFKCANKGFRVKMDYIHNRHEKAGYTVYNVDSFECPRCKQIYEAKVRIEGRGKSGFNAGKVLGSK